MKPKILFCYYTELEHLWRDGLWAALQILQKDYEITMANFAKRKYTLAETEEFDLVLGWGAFESDIARFVKQVTKPNGLLIGGYTYEPHGIKSYDILFYETEWYTDQINYHPNIVHAFGINTDIWKPEESTKVIDYLVPGAFAAWKRQIYVAEKKGIRLCVGEIQNDNDRESIKIMGQLIIHGVGVMPPVTPEELHRLTLASKTVFIPADMMGGGERSLLESRACGIPVEIKEDNDKLKELMVSPIWDQNYYAAQLKKGIESVIN